jgi:hypothetical protein
MPNILYIKIGGGKRKPQLQSRNKSSTRSSIQQYTPQKVKKIIERKKKEANKTLVTPSKNHPKKRRKYLIQRM